MILEPPTTATEAAERVCFGNLAYALDTRQLKGFCVDRATFLEFALKAIMYQPITKAEAAAKQQAVPPPPNPLRGGTMPIHIVGLLPSACLLLL